MGEAIPETATLARYCGGSKLIDDMPVGAAFSLRPNEKFLSVNWLEYFSRDDRNGQIEKVLSDVNRAQKTGKTSKLALFDLAKAISFVSSATDGAIQLSATHEPIDDPLNESHAGLRGYLVDNVLVENALAEIVVETVPAHRTEDAE